MIEKANCGNNKWTLYLLTTLIVFVATQLGGIPLIVYAWIKDPAYLTNGNIMELSGTNIGFALMLLTFVAGFFALLFCAKYIHRKNYLDIITGRNRFDWKRAWFGFGLWAIMSILSLCITLSMHDSSDIVFQFQPVNFFILLLIALLFLPFQTSFEELFFRGYLMQGSTLLFQSKWGALLFTSLLFGAMHLSNPEIDNFGLWVALPQYVFMGLFLGYITLKDNGLELAIGVHAANNIISGITYTSNATALQTHALFKDLNPTSSHWDTLSLLIFALVFIGATNYKFHYIKKNIFSL